MFDVSTYGATGDGTTDDREAIQDAIDACALAGGGKVWFPKGTYLIDSSVNVIINISPEVTTPVGIVVSDDNVFLEGEGRGLSIVKLGDSVNAQLVGFGDAVNTGISKLELDGNRANQTGSWSALYTHNNLTAFTARDLFVHHASGYGVGLQQGDFIDLLLSDILVEDSGSDGIDIKNTDMNHRNNRMNNITVRRSGLNTSLSGQAQIDIRGIWNLNSIISEDFNNSAARCTAGIRFRTGPSGQELVGAQWSTLTNFYIEGTVDSTVNGITAEAYQVQIVGGQIRNCGKGILFNGPEVGVGDVTARECTYGFFMDTDSNGTNLSGCTARSNSSTGFYVKSDGCSITGLQSRGNDYGISLQSTSQNTVLSGVSTANTTNLYTEAGHTKNSTGLIS